MIQIKNVSKSFEQLKVLDNISFSASSAEITSIIGPSGSGKTTLLRCITGLENHFTGEVLISGLAQNVYLADRRIAFVTQQYSNFLWMTVTQNIEIGLSKQNRSKRESQEIVTKLISDLQLEGFEKYYVNKLSGGMKQRVAIGRALAQGTEFLAMDEPFGALDYQTRVSLQILIKKINKEYHKTILFVTHDIEEAISISDRIIVLSKLPSLKIAEYEVPSHIGDSPSTQARFSKDFLLLRENIEEDLKRLEGLNSALSLMFQKRWAELETIDLFNHISLNQIRQQFRAQFDQAQQYEVFNHLLNEEHPTLASLGAMLMKNIEVPSQLENLLWDRFQRSSDFETKYFLLHEISNRTDDTEKRQQLFGFIRDHLAEYLRAEERYFTSGGHFHNEIVFDSIKARIEDDTAELRSYKKRWVLLISLLSVQDIAKSRSYIAGYRNDEDEFVKMVVSWLLSKIGETP